MYLSHPFAPSTGSTKSVPEEGIKESRWVGRLWLEEGRVWKAPWVVHHTAALTA